MDYPKSDPAAGLLNDKFTDGDPLNGTPASKDSAAYQNMVFDELINLISGAGLVPDENDVTQILQAIRNGGRPARTVSQNDYAELPGGLILQWGNTVTTNGAGVWTFPIPFPEGCVAVFAGNDASDSNYGLGANPDGGFGTPSNKTQAILSSQVGTGNDGLFVYAIGS